MRFSARPTCPTCPTFCIHPSKSMTKPSMRDQMPVCAEFIDQLREVFGKDHIDGQIRAGMRGEPTFFASENGHTLGTPIPYTKRTKHAAD